MLGITFDGASANRRFLKLHNASSSHAITYKVQNKYDPQRFIYFFSDPSHLIKTACNCLASSARHMQVNLFPICNLFHCFWQYKGKSITIKHIEEVYYIDKGNSFGLSVLPKIKLNT